MEYIHVINLEKYHPGYKDRELQWFKCYFNMVNADPEFEMVEEVDKWRFIALIMLELQSKKPIPVNENYLTRKGFDIKKRPIFLTIKMLHNFICVVTEENKSCVARAHAPENKSKNKRREEKDNKLFFVQEIFNHWNTFKGRGNFKSHREMTPDIEKAVKIRLKDKFTIEQLKGAINNYAQILISSEYEWSYAWTLYQFLTRHRPDNRDELQIYRFIPNNFSTQDFKKTSLGKQRDKIRKEKSQKILKADAEKLKAAYENNYEHKWLIDELRPEISEEQK